MKKSLEKKIVILGSGPCGLGAAWRLQELNYPQYKLFDRMSHPGGLASSYKDDKGFTWDVGCHVQHSHYSYFDNLMDSLLGSEWLVHERRTWVWLRGRFVPYPFQNNIRYLAREDLAHCVKELVEIHQKPIKKTPANFQEWIVATFGKGIADIFMLPYNYKVWAYDARKMGYSWIGDRVTVTDLKRVLENVILEKDDVSWGPNHTFRFPRRGGTGEIWQRLYNRLDQNKTYLNHEAHFINTSKKYVTFSNGHKEDYDVLISTMPLDMFIKKSDVPGTAYARQLMHSSVYIVGVGMKGKIPAHVKPKTWIYFPDGDCPFYRVTVFSEYSPDNVPDARKHWSLIVEVSHSSDKSMDPKTVREEVIQGLLNTKLLRSRKEIVSVWQHFEPYGYPTPSLRRDNALSILKELEKRSVYSRGRFGAWKYEVSNQDHTCMQGVEVVNRLLLGEKEMTVWYPEIVNRGKQ